MQTERRTADEQYRLIMECRSSGLSDFSGATSTGSNPVHSTTGSSGFAKNPAMIFRRKQAGEAISLRNNRMLSNFVIDFSDFVKQGKVII